MLSLYTLALFYIDSSSFQEKYPTRRGECGEEWPGVPLWSPVFPQRI